MANDPLGDAIRVLEYLRSHRPSMNDVCRFGRMEIEFRDGVVLTIGPLPALRRGKDFPKDGGGCADT